MSRSQRSEGDKEGGRQLSFGTLFPIFPSPHPTGSFTEILDFPFIIKSSRVSLPFFFLTMTTFQFVSFCDPLHSTAVLLLWHYGLPIHVIFTCRISLNILPQNILGESQLRNAEVGKGSREVCQCSHEPISVLAPIAPQFWGPIRLFILF